MIRGHLEQEVKTAAFSSEILSAGRPSFFHIAWSDKFARIDNGSTPSVNGIFFAFISSNQFYLQSFSQNTALNGPIYETNAAESKASPIIVIPS